MERREFLQHCGLLSIAGYLTACGSSDPLAVTGDAIGGLDPQAAAAPLPAPDPLVHLLKRSRFGTTAADLAAARAQGINGYLEQQLNPQQMLPDLVELQAAVRFPVTELPLTAAYYADAFELSEITRQLAEKTVFLGTYSDRQLFEVMVGFWTDHFNIDNVTGNLPRTKPDFDRNVIRANAFSSFRALLHASAKSPAMLEYLDGMSNVADGPNENYARELMELHTLGVDGGYTEADVKEVARCFTGWGINGTTRMFEFHPQRHDTEEKHVLGTVIPAGGGVEDGEAVLDLLASHPSTARFIATKLVRHFVADQAPAVIVEAVRAAFSASDGDIPTLLRALFLHPDFASYADYKLKRPLNYVCGALRAYDNDASHYPGTELLSLLSRLGQVPHRWFAPDGYPDVASYWLSASGLLERWNFAAELVETRGLFGESPASALVEEGMSAEQLVDALAAKLIMRTLRTSDRAALITIAGSDGPLTGETLNLAAERVAGLLLASPYFNLR